METHSNILAWRSPWADGPGGLQSMRSQRVGYNVNDLACRHAAAAAAKSLQSCPTLCNPMDCSPPAFSVHGILQARTLEWVAISFSNALKWKVKMKSCLTLSDPMDCSLPGFSVHVILPARTLEWVAISFSNALKWKVKVKSLSRV